MVLPCSVQEVCPYPTCLAFGVMGGKLLVSYLNLTSLDPNVSFAVQDLSATGELTHATGKLPHA